MWNHNPVRKLCPVSFTFQVYGAESNILTKFPIHRNIVS